MWRGLVLVGGSILGLMQAGPSIAGEFPVRWSPALQLDSLDQIDERWTRPVLKERPIRFRARGDWESPGEARAVADNCARYFDLLRNEYEPDPAQYDEVGEFGSACFTIHLLRRVSPAAKGFLASFRLDETAPSRLPGGIAESENTELTLAAESIEWDPTPQSWRDLWKTVVGPDIEPAIRVLGPDHTAYAWRNEETTLRLLAWGDFTRDGIEDVVVSVRTRFGGSGRGTRLLALSQTEGFEVLRVAKNYSRGLTRSLAPSAPQLSDLPWRVGSAANHEIPVRWSPDLPIKAPDKIDEAFQAPIYPDGDAFTVGRGWQYIDQEWVAAEEADIKVCADFERLIKAGYSVQYQMNWNALVGLGVHCAEIAAMKKASPSRVSFLEEFRLDENAPDILPAILRGTLSSSDYEEDIVDSQKGVSWVTPDHPMAFNVIDEGPFKAQYEDEDGGTIVTLLARADFDDDGIEDLLLEYVAYGTMASAVVTGAVILTRLSGDAVMRLVSVLDNGLGPD